jgi:hypothetical protein
MKVLQKLSGILQKQVSLFWAQMKVLQQVWGILQMQVFQPSVPQPWVLLPSAIQP